MRIAKSNKAIEAIRSNERMRDALVRHLEEVRQHEMEMLSTATDELGSMRFMQGRIAALNDMIKALQ